MKRKWKATEELIRASRIILAEESPMTLRQLYYRLVSKHILENKRSEYQKLSRVLTRARNSGEIDFADIVDRSKVEHIPNTWDNPQDYMHTVANAYKRDRWNNQPYHIEVWLEKDTLTGPIQDLCKQYSVSLRALRGFSSTTQKNQMARYFVAINKPVFILYVGDHDPSGIDIERDLIDTLQRYGAYNFEVFKVAILKDDISIFNLPPLVANAKDPRIEQFKATYGTDAVEADALPPSELRSRIKDQILIRLDMDEWKKTEAIEKVEMQAIKDMAEKYTGIGGNI